MKPFTTGKIGLYAVLAVLCLAPRLSAKEINIVKGSGGSGGNTYSSLEEFRQALVANPALVGDGDVINIHNDDDTLTAGINLPKGIRITIRSVNGRHTVEGRANPKADAYIYTDLAWASGEEPHIVLENITMANNSRLSGSAVSFTSHTPTPATLRIANSTFENNDGFVAGGVKLHGNAQGAIINSVFTGNSGFDAGAIAMVNEVGEGPVKLNLVFDENAQATTTWSGNSITPFIGSASPNSISISVDADRQAELNVNVAGNKVFNLADPFLNMVEKDSTIDINKVGAGTWKLDGTSDTLLMGSNDATVNINIREGRMHFKDTMRWYGWEVDVTDPNNPIIGGQTGIGRLNVSKDAVFKPSVFIPANYVPSGNTGPITGGYFTVLHLDTFNSAEGARLEVGGISRIPELIYSDGTVSITNKIVQVESASKSNISSTMEMNNGLVNAVLEWGGESDPNTMILRIKRVNNLSSLSGVGVGMDIYRKRDDLTEAERDWLDDIYARGGPSQSDKAFMQTMNGDTVMLSQLAMRHNLSNALQKITRRTTDFQNEELQIGSSGTSGAIRGNYGEIWAYMDKSWMGQKDTGALAGYHYNPLGLGIGYDYHSDQWIFGGLVSYEDGDIELRSGKKTHTEVQSAVASLYASYATEGIYITGGLQAGYAWNKSRSHYELIGLRENARSGTYGTHLLGASAEVGYMMDMGSDSEPMRVTPYSGISYARINREAFSESGSERFNRQFRTARWNMFDWTLGVRASKPMSLGGIKVIPAVDLAFARTMGSPNSGGRNVHFINDPGNLWKINVLDNNRNALRLGGGVTAQIRENLDIGLQYDFEWRRKFTSHNANLNVAWGF